MKVLHVFNELKYSGAEIMYVGASNLFLKNKFDLTAISTGDNVGVYSNKFESAGYEVCHKALPPTKHFLGRIRYIIWLIKFLRVKQFDLVHILRVYLL